MALSAIAIKAVKTTGKVQRLYNANGLYFRASVRINVEQDFGLSTGKLIDEFE